MRPFSCAPCKPRHALTDLMPRTRRCYCPLPPPPPHPPPSAPPPSLGLNDSRWRQECVIRTRKSPSHFGLSLRMLSNILSLTHLRHPAPGYEERHCTVRRVFPQAPVRLRHELRAKAAAAPAAGVRYRARVIGIPSSGHTGFFCFFLNLGLLVLRLLGLLPLRL